MWCGGANGSAERSLHMYELYWANTHRTAKKTNETNKKEKKERNEWVVWMTNEDRVQIALGLKFQCKKCNFVITMSKYLRWDLPSSKYVCDKCKAIWNKND